MEVYSDISPKRKLKYFVRVKDPCFYKVKTEFNPWAPVFSSSLLLDLNVAETEDFTPATTNKVGTSALRTCSVIYRLTGKVVDDAGTQLSLSSVN